MCTSLCFQYHFPPATAPEESRWERRIGPPGWEHLSSRPAWNPPLAPSPFLQNRTNTAALKHDWQSNLTHYKTLTSVMQFMISRKLNTLVLIFDKNYFFLLTFFLIMFLKCNEMNTANCFPLLFQYKMSAPLQSQMGKLWRLFNSYLHITFKYIRSFPAYKNFRWPTVRFQADPK